MFLLIDMDRLVVVHRHHLGSVLGDLADIELMSTFRILPIDSRKELSRFTDLELRKLYCSFGTEECPVLRDTLLSSVLEAFSQVLVSDVDPQEASAQASCIASTDRGRYRYVRGSRRPARMGDLWEPPAVAVGTLPVHSVPVEPDRPAVASSTAPSAARGAAGPKTSLIWEVADRLWGGAGKPSNIGEVLKIRKQAMDELERSGIKRTTASSSLGAWQKDRLKL